MRRAMQLKAKIRNLAQEKRLPAQVILQNYMLERLLERIALSPYQSMIILKGGMLIASMVGIESRSTMDMDATIKNFTLTEHHIRTMFEQILGIKLDDEVMFQLLRIDEIRETDAYSGYRLSLEGVYDTVNVPLKIDLSTGDRITPEAIQYDFKLLFEQRTIPIWSYNIETVLAEKMETIITRGILNTRLRDFYDVYILSKLETIKFDQSLYSEAVAATIERRGSSGVTSKVETVIKTIRNDITMQDRWLKYQREFEYARGITFNETLDVIERLALFI